MEDGSVSYGTPTNGASPGSNPILAQPPLQPDTSGADDQAEGMPQFSLVLPTQPPLLNAALLTRTQ